MDKSIDWRTLPQYMMSIHRKWAAMEVAGWKTDEVRVSAPKVDRSKGAVVWLYETKRGGGCRAVSAVFYCPAIHPVSGKALIERRRELSTRSRLSIEELLDYKGEHRLLYFWEIGDIRWLPQPIPLSAFGMERPPMSWCRCKVPEGLQ